MLAVLIATIFVVVLLLVTLNHANRVDQELSCAGNLRLLAQAAHAYADDHQGSFFYHWPTKLDTSGQYQPGSAGSWYDQKRLGKYLPELDGTKQVYLQNTDQHGVLQHTGRPLICPNSPEGVARNYEMNFWASGIGPLEDVSAKWFVGGKFFNRDDIDQSDKLILFGEAYATQMTDKGLKRTDYVPSAFGACSGVARSVWRA